MGVFIGLLLLGLVLVGVMVVLGELVFELCLIYSRGLGFGVVDVLVWMILVMGVWGGLSLLVCGCCWYLVLVLILVMVWVLYSLVGYLLLNDFSFVRGLMCMVGSCLGLDVELGLVVWKE